MLSFPNNLSYSSKHGCKFTIFQSKFQNPYGFLATPTQIMLIKKLKIRKFVLGMRMREMTRDVCHAICYGQNWPKRRINLKTDLESQDVGASAHTLTKSVMFLL